jgi:hypothetical protein
VPGGPTSNLKGATEEPDEHRPAITSGLACNRKRRALDVESQTILAVIFGGPDDGDVSRCSPHGAKRPMGYIGDCLTDHLRAGSGAQAL